MDKAAIKKAYKQAKQLMRVYRIKTSQNEKTYIGYATNLQAGFNRHKAELKFGSHRNKELQEIWYSYGESAFEFEILDVLDNEENSQANAIEELQTLTEMWIQKLQKTAGSVIHL